MKRHDFIIGTLVKTGFRTSLKGFDQFCMCVEMYSDACPVTIDSVYTRVADKFRCTKGSVEKNLQRLLSNTEACSGIAELFGLDRVDVSNKEMIAMVSNYVKLQHEKYGD